MEILVNSAPMGRRPAVSSVLPASGLAIALMATRWPIAPRYLFDFDNVNFALALRQFAPALSQPHRGYPLYVLVSRAVHWFVPSPEWTALVMGLVGSLLALLFMIPLARDMFGSRAAWIAPALLFFHPCFVLAGTVDHVRTFLAAGAIATALFVWRGQLKTAAFVLGVAGGFRTELLPTLLPLLLSPLLLQRVSWKRFVAPIAILTATVAPWFLFTAWKSGGVRSMLHANSDMLRQSFGGHSIWYEGFTTAAIGTALLAIYWNGIGGLGWLWAVPAGVRRQCAAGRWREFVFLAIWFVPPFLLSAVVHIVEPDQALTSIAATCLAGAWALSALKPRWTVLACVISAAVFVFPPKRLGREASLPWIRRISSIEARAIEETARTPAPRLIVIRGAYPTWRLMSYYFPDDWVQNREVTAHGNRTQSSGPPQGLRARVVVASE